MRSSVTSIRCACATARLYRVFLFDRISARNLSLSPAADVTVSVGAGVSAAGAGLLGTGAGLTGATTFLVGATVSLAGARLGLVTPSLAVAAGGVSLRTGAAPPL